MRPIYINLVTGTTCHFICFSDSHQLQYVRPALHPKTVTLSDGHTVQSTHVGRIHLPSQPETATECDIFSEWAGDLTDHGCTAAYDAASVIIRNSKGDIILTGIGMI